MRNLWKTAWVCMVIGALAVDPGCVGDDEVTSSRSSAVLEDADGDGIADTLSLDTDGDGQEDLIVDLSGIAELCGALAGAGAEEPGLCAGEEGDLGAFCDDPVIDGDGDGVPEGIDQDCDGIADHWCMQDGAIDADCDGLAEFDPAVDVQGLEQCWDDADGDGLPSADEIDAACAADAAGVDVEGLEQCWDDADGDGLPSADEVDLECLQEHAGN